MFQQAERERWLLKQLLQDLIGHEVQIFLSAAPHIRLPDNARVPFLSAAYEKFCDTPIFRNNHASFQNLMDEFVCMVPSLHASFFSAMVSVVAVA